MYYVSNKNIAKVEIKFPNNDTYDVLGVLYEKEDSKDWVSEEGQIEEEKGEQEVLAKFQLLYKTFVWENNATPTLSALLAIDNE